MQKSVVFGKLKLLQPFKDLCYQTFRAIGKWL